MPFQEHLGWNTGVCPDGSSVGPSEPGTNLATMPEHKLATSATPTATAIPATGPVIGAHVESSDPLTTALGVGAAAMQFFLADPQGWKAPRPHQHADRIVAADLTVYIHSP